MNEKSNNGLRRPRPTLLVGLGGSGHRIALQLKVLLLQHWPAEQIEQLVRILVFDTAQEELSLNYRGKAIILEPGSEIIDIGQTPVANIKRNLAQQSAIQARLGNVMAALPPTVLRSGAKQLRALGLLAFLWLYTVLEPRLREAIWALANRSHQNGQGGINTFIFNSLGGGTGSSLFIDMAYVIRELFDELGTLADFCYITGVGLLPQAFPGINGPNLIPNTVASLKELNHCMTRGEFKVRYPNGRVITTAQPPFNVFYLVDGVDAAGHTWGGPGDIYRLAAEGIFLQMGSQVGQKHENDFDNLDEILSRQTEEGYGTFYGSFGLASLVFPAQAVAQACAARQAVRVIEEALLASPQATLPEEMAALVEAWLETAGLESAPLAEALARDDQGAPLAVELGVPGWVNRLAKAAIPGELSRYVRDYEQARLGYDFRRWLSQNETELIRQKAGLLAAYLTRLARQEGLPAARAWLAELISRLAHLAEQLNQRQVERESQQIALSQELGHLELIFLQAGESGFLGRGRRIARAQHSYMTTAQALFGLRWESQVTASMLKLLNQVSWQAQEGLNSCQGVGDRLKVALRSLQEAQAAAASGLSGVTTRSLADEALVAALFERHAPPVADTLALLFSQEASPLDWRELAPAGLEARLLAACQPAFGAVAGLSVEQVITLQKESVSPESYHTWLFQQATPSWNLDRTRLPDGGAAIQRVEVLGVPDETTSLYRQHARTLVSTGDPTRLTAFVAHLGAPHTAVQQWESYQALYHQVRGQVPLHVLPQFQADSERARQTFALGSIFGFITSQGAYFYYNPADALARPVKLGQGLANSLQLFTAKEGLIQEARERIEQVVAGRGVEAILRILRRYYEGSNGRYPADELVLELKRLVRAYADELRQIHQFTAWPDEPEAPDEP